MYLLYLDASGVPESHPSQTSHYVLVGVAIHFGTWFALNKRVTGLKRGFLRPGQTEIELHAGWLLRPYWDQIEILDFEDLGYPARYEAILRWRKAREELDWPKLPAKQKRRERAYFRLADPFVHLGREERNALVDGALELIGNYRRGLNLFAEAIDKAALRAEVDPVDQAFTQVVSRFEAFLKRRRKPAWGMVVSDHDQHRAQQLTKMLERFQRQGTRWGEVDRVIEAPFFQDSYANSGVQLADVCSYAVRRYLENGEVDRFKRVFKKFDRTSTGLHGIRHFTQRGCPCMICKERGHI